MEEVARCVSFFPWAGCHAHPGPRIRLNFAGLLFFSGWCTGTLHLLVDSEGLRHSTFRARRQCSGPATQQVVPSVRGCVLLVPLFAPFGVHGCFSGPGV